MKIYRVNKPFMSRTDQFEEGKHSLVIGIEANALKEAGVYKVFLGKNEKVYYEVSFVRAMELYRKYGKEALWKRNGRDVFILPVFELERVEINTEEQSQLL